MTRNLELHWTLIALGKLWHGVVMEYSEVMNEFRHNNYHKSDNLEPCKSCNKNKQSLLEESVKDTFQYNV